MTSSIVNGAPMALSLGTRDLSTREVPNNPEAIPQHLPVCFLFTQRGRGRHLVDGASRENIFGTKSFDPRSKYFNHSTLFANEFNAQGNSCMVERMIPTDAGPRANAILWLDVLETTVDRYQRNPDGTIALDSLSNPTITGTTPGLKMKWVKTYRTTVVDQEAFGTKTQVQGDQVDSGTNTHSVRYPIFEIEESSEGADGNNTGFRIWPVSSAGGASIPTKLMSKYQQFPYNFMIVKREDANSSTKYVKTITGETSSLFTFARDVVNPNTDAQVGYDQVIVQAYNQTDEPGYPDIIGRMNKFHVYESNIEAVLDLMYDKEKDFITTSSDITEDESSKGLLNFVTAASSAGVPYESVVFVDSSTSVRLSSYSDVFLSGGADGTMSDEMFETLVGQALDRYADATDEVQDIAYNVESVVYDSGFSIDAKLKLAQFIAVRKDTCCILGTHTVGDPTLTESEEHSLAIALRTRLQMFPESTYFGTPVMRAMIMGRSGLVRNSQYTKRVPLTFEVGSKLAAYMGAGNGAWKSGFSPMGAPGSIVRRMKDINITFVSDNVRNRNWDVGLNFVARYDRDDYYIPALKTVYDNDTSVLNSILTVFACAQLNKIGLKVHREYSGTDVLSSEQICDKSNAMVSRLSANIFDGRYVVVPEATVTDSDALRGYSWTLPIKLYANNMKTVMVTYVEAQRLADLANNTTGAQ